MDFIKPQIAYCDGYKYQLRELHCDTLDFAPTATIITDYLYFDTACNFKIEKGYAWDGPSGLTIDSKDFMRGSLVHDALYQLMREGHLDHDKVRDLADRTLQRICVEDGMSTFRAWYVYHGVRIFGNPFADPANDKPVIFAP